MKKLGVFVGEKGNWTFFSEIFNYLSSYYQVEVFKEKVYKTPLLYGRLNRWNYKREIKKILKHNDICFFEWASELLVEASHMPKYSLLITRLHSYEIYFWTPKINWDNVDKIVLVSNAMQEKFNNLYPKQSHKTLVIYNGISLEDFQPSENEFNINIGMLCSIHPRKRIYEVILMLRELINEGYNAQLHIAGGQIRGPDLDEYFIAIQRLVVKMNLDSKVFFYNHVENTASWLKEVDIFISNSYWEGQQVALLEAMASGCYCLSHFWDGVEEVLPAECIFATEHELQQKIIAYSDMDENKRRQHQNRMRAIACEKFDIEQTKTRIRAVIEEVGNGTAR